MAIVGDAYVVVHAITTGFEREVRKGLTGIDLNGDGRRVGESFSRGFSNGVGNNMSGAFSNVTSEAELARRAFQSMVRTGYVLGTTLSTVVSSVGALAGGLISLASAAGAAAPALIVLPGILTSLGLAALTAKAAFSGVFNAIKAGTNAQKAAAKDTTATEAAQKRLIRVMEQVTEAQDNVTKAMKRAKEEVQQLGFDAEDAAIGEKKAAIELEKARETLMRTQDLPPNSRARREAQLAFAEAELNLRRAKDRNKDLKTQQSELADAAAKNGTEQWAQTQTYLDAKKQERDSLRDLKDAQDDLAKAQKGGAADQSYNIALSDLSPAAQDFVKYVTNTFIPALKELRDAAATALLPLVKEGLETLRTKLFPVLKPLLAELGESIGKAFKTFVKAVVDPENLKDLKTIFGTAGKVVEDFGKIAGNVYDSVLSVLAAADPLIRRFTDFLVKKTGEFAKFLDTKQATGELQKFFDKAGDILAQIGAIFGNTFSGIGNVIKANFSPGGGGYILLDWLEKITGEFEKFSGSTKGQNSLAEYFKEAAKNSISILESVGAFVKEILKAGANPSIREFWDTLKQGAPIFGDILKAATDAGPSLAKLVVNILKFVKATTDAGAVKIFFETLSTVLGAINTLLENKLIKSIFNVTGKIFAFGLALGTIGKVGKFGMQVVSGNLEHIGKMVKAIVPAPVLAKVKSGLETIALKAMYAFDKVKAGAAAAGSKILQMAKGALPAAAAGIRSFATASMALLTSPIFLIGAAIAAIVVGLVVLYNKSEKFREIVDKVFGKIKDAAVAAFNWIKENWPLILAILTGPIGLAVLAIVKNWDEIVAFVKGIPEKIKNAAGAMWNWIGEKLSAAFTAIKEKFNAIVEWVKGIPGMLRTAAGNIWGWISSTLATAYENLKTNFTTIVTFVASLPGRIRTAAAGMWDGIKNGFRDALNWIIAKWNSFRIDARIPENTFTKALGIANKGFTLDTPDIPPLALGGIVSPSSQGTIVRVAEAGRPERIEPLDAQGLSKRDRAMIQMLAGGAGSGATINVYPSQGMDEVQVASIVSRQLAFQLRRGGV